jgi:hypothetical protein
MLRLPGRSWVVDGAQDERRYDGVHGRVGQRQALDPESALREVARLLRPNERLLLIEHVRAKSWFLAACQDKLLQSWRVFAGGCVCNRPTLELMRACGFAVEADDVVWHGMPAIVHPLAVGCAARLSVGRASR